MQDADLFALAEDVGAACTRRGLLVAVAESCTGGWTAQMLTAVAGSSAWFERGFVAYANAAKVEMLGVDPHLLAQHGAVSLETAAAMAQGALRRSHAHVSCAITGVAGPGGGTPQKPTGFVCFAWGERDSNAVIKTTSCEQKLFSGDREAVRRQSVMHALNGLLRLARHVP